MSFKYFDHKADIGIVGIGASLEEAFQEASKAMFNVMVDIKKVEKTKKIKITCDASNEEELLVEWLNKLLAEATINEMVFSDFSVQIKNNTLSGTAAGEKLDHKKHKVKIEVKAATYSQLKIEKKGSNFIVQCVVDV